MGHVKRVCDGLDACELKCELKQNRSEYDPVKDFYEWTFFFDGDAFHEKECEDRHKKLREISEAPQKRKVAGKEKKES